MSTAGDADPAIGPIEAAVLAELARDAPGGLRSEMSHHPGTLGGFPDPPAARPPFRRGGQGGLSVPKSPEGTDCARQAELRPRVPPAGRGALRLLRGGGAAGAGDTVVLLHGRGHAAPIWFPCWPALAARHALLAIDLPGFGQSAAPALPARRRLDAEAALAAFVDPIEACLAAEVAAGRAPGLALVGHSLGGLVALELALRARLPVRRLVLIDAMGLGPAMTGAGRALLSPAPGAPAALARAAALRPPQSVAGDAARPPGGRARARVAGGADRGAGACGGGARVRCAVPALGAGVSPRARLGEIAVPVWLLWGARDAALPTALATAARAELRAAHSLILAQGHSPHLDSPGEALPPLLDFLARAG